MIITPDAGATALLERAFNMSSYVQDKIRLFTNLTNSGDSVVGADFENAVDASNNIIELLVNPDSTYLYNNSSNQITTDNSVGVSTIDFGNYVFNFTGELGNATNKTVLGYYVYTQIDGDYVVLFYEEFGTGLTLTPVAGDQLTINLRYQLSKGTPT